MDHPQSEHPGASGTVHTMLRCPGRNVARHRAPARRPPPAEPEPHDTEPHDTEPAEPHPGGPEPAEPVPASVPASGQDAGTRPHRSLLRALVDRLGRWRRRDASDLETPEQGWTVRITPTWHDWD